MVLYRVYGDPVVRDYYSTVCSRATLFIIVIYCLTLVPPALIAYSTNGFWRTASRYHEQPDVRYLDEYIVLVGWKEGGAAAWSSLPNYTPPPGIDILLEPLNTSFYEEDTDGDKRRENLFFTFEILSSSMNVSSVELLLFFSLRLSAYTSVNMDSAVYISNSGSLTTPTTGLWIGGDLAVHQRRPLPASGRSNSYEPLLNTSSLLWEDYDISGILSTYRQRDLSVYLQPVYSVRQYNDTTTTDEGGFQIEAEIKYIEQSLSYRPGFWEQLKWAWIQYLPIAILFWFSLSLVKSFVFQNHIVPTIKPYSH